VWRLLGAAQRGARGSERPLTVSKGATQSFSARSPCLRGKMETREKSLIIETAKPLRASPKKHRRTRFSISPWRECFSKEGWARVKGSNGMRFSTDL
jgi:hypothetical protein